MRRAKEKQMMELFQRIQLTSKASVKTQCLLLAHGDVDKAEKMYDFLSKDMDLPDAEPTPKPVLGRIAEEAGGIFNWLKENREDLMQMVDFARGLISRKPVIPTPTDLPPINMKP